MEPKTLYDVATVPKVDRKRLNSSKDLSEKPRPDLRRARLFLSRLRDPALERICATHRLQGRAPMHRAGPRYGGGPRVRRRRVQDRRGRVGADHRQRAIRDDGLRRARAGRID
jgi:hypothetical protein